MRPIKKGSTDQSVVIRIIDSEDGTPENGVEHNTDGIDLWYRREKETKTSIVEAALGSLDAAHSDGGIELIGDGYYRLDLPDAAVAAGAGENGVMVGGTVTGMIVIGCYVPLVDYNPYDTVRMGMIALPDAAADAAGGVPISDAGGLDLDAIKVVTDKIDSAQAEPGQGAPAVNATPLVKLAYLFKSWRNKRDNDGSTTKLYNDAGDTVDQKRTTSADAGTLTKGKIAAGP